MEIDRLSDHAIAYSESMDYVALYGPDHELVDCGDRSDVFERIVEQLPFKVWYDAAVYDGTRDRDNRVPRTLVELEARTEARAKLLRDLAEARRHVAELEGKLK